MALTGQAYEMSEDESEMRWTSPHLLFSASTTRGEKGRVPGGQVDSSSTGESDDRPVRFVEAERSPTVAAHHRKICLQFCSTHMHHVAGEKLGEDGDVLMMEWKVFTVQKVTEFLWFQPTVQYNLQQQGNSRMRPAPGTHFPLAKFRYRHDLCWIICGGDFYHHLFSGNK